MFTFFFKFSKLLSSTLLLEANVMDSCQKYLGRLCLIYLGIRTTILALRMKPIYFEDVENKYIIVFSIFSELLEMFLCISGYPRFCT